MITIVATVFMLFFTISQQKSKFRLISEISEFFYLVLGQIQKLRKLGKIFLSFMTDLNFVVKCDYNGDNCFDAFLYYFIAKE